jgi:hypothetical protein
MVDRVSGATNRVAQRLEQTATRLKDAEQRLVGASSGYVRDHPFKTAGIALAAVFLVSYLAAPRNPVVRHGERDALADAKADASATPRKR